MQIVRTFLWVLILVLMLAFSFFNWRPVEVQIWDNLVLETKVPALVVISFLIGLVPMWLIHRGTRWRLQRRVTALENAARSQAVTPVVPATMSQPAPAEPLTKDVPVASAPVAGAPVPRDEILG